MFKSSPDASQFIPLKSVIIKPEAQVDYTPEINQCRFLFPKYHGFFDPRQSRLQYNITMSGRGRRSAAPPRS